MTYEFWKDFSGPIATVIASITAAGITVYFGFIQARIACQQAKISKQQADMAKIRLNHDLYDRRFAIYSAASRIFQEILTKNDVDNLDIIAFVKETATTQFLVGSEIVEYFDGIRKKARRMQRVGRRIQQAKDDEDVSELINEQMDLSDWFETQFEVIADKFKPYLSLEIQNHR